MSARSKQSKTETVTSILLLIVLVLIGTGIFFKQFHYDAVRLDIAQALAELPAQKAGVTEIDFASLLPAGFDEMTDVETFERDTLYVKINGKADLYLQSGFKKLSCQRFVSSDDEKLWAELYLYDMGTARNAFAVYGVQRRVNAVDLALSRFSYKADNAIFLTTGAYYAEIIAAEKSEKLQNTMLTVAENVAKLFPAGEDLLGELKLFPVTGLVANSFKLHLTSAFGFEALDDTFTAKYKLGGETITAFISQRQSAEQANELARNYYQFLIDNGATATSAVNDNLAGNVLDFYDSIEIILVAGPVVVGIHEAYDQSSAEELVLMLKDNVSEVVKVGTGR
jgi:hypothetical protein